MSSEEQTGPEWSDRARVENAGPREQADDVAAEIAQLKDQALRAQAELDNIRRRAARDVENAHRFANEKLITALAPVVDNLERAVVAARAATHPEAAAIAEGVDLSLRLLTDTLTRFGVETVDPLGEPFNPQFHQAMSMVESPHMEPNSVMQVLQRGYSLNGRLIRPAMVVVTRAAGPQLDERA